MGKNHYIKQLASIIFMMLLCSVAHSQFYNKEVKAKILVEQNSEFYTFKATAENMTPSDYNLRYDFMVFRKDEKGNTSKSNQENRFYLKANEKLILSTTAINYNADGRIIIVLVIYDQDNNPIGQDRLDLAKGGRTPEKDMIPEEVEPVSQDQAKPNDGFVLGGLVIENTITKAGRDFYRYFYSDYFNRGIKSQTNIAIDEVPGRGRTTMISVKVGDQLVWRFFSQPRKDFLKKMAGIAMQRSLRQLQRLAQQKEEFTRY
ncbi:CsgE family curli-type amyloid fiber assembly protein [Zeaxanthinibacter sp. PT1]|uniref:CsgE family curli-type amyloid fiber assembly protein n=1 Tax=Zeaxanthinibacter TaxID=561554 RepID=UPI00234A4E7E|nr:CsgE family curli-type amyloid fiber assembly protein [Zeaxanthinibacter sp. PT1]MDC6352451.1 CsgE family curli-type amyloid fiber assembly protein [Zeaxanthinibacter sp. PT1]